MKELNTTFKGRGQVKGYVFSQIRRTKHAYLYEVKGNNTTHYEVFNRKINTMYDCVSYPTDKDLGLWAWTFGSLDFANEKFNKINEQKSYKIYTI